MEIAIVGAGIAGLALALELHDAGIPCRVYEAVPEIEPAGVGINILPHGSAVLCRLGLESELERIGITTQESAFFNRFGQLIHREPSGRYAGYESPQFSIHRPPLHGSRPGRDGRHHTFSLSGRRDATGSNGGGQAILDAHALRRALVASPTDTAAALTAYEELRLPATSAVVRTNRTTPPDILLKEVLDRIEDVISADEIEAISQRYKLVAGYTKEGLRHNAA